MKIRDKYSLRQKMYFYILTGFLLLFFAMGTLTYHIVFNLILEQGRDNGMSVAHAAACDLDSELFASIKSEDSAAFRIVRNTLLKYQEFSSIHYVYTMKMVDGKLFFVVDADPVDPAAYMEEYPVFDAILPAFEGVVTSDKGTTSDRWGTYVSSYAPIFDSDNNVIGVVGVDTKVEYINAYRNSLIGILLAILLLFAVIGSILYVYITNDFLGKDSLTELMTQDKLESMAKFYEKQGTLHEYTVIMLNIADFSMINSKYGYAVGDKLLKYIADYLRSLTKNTGIVARNSSDNFTIMIRNRELNSIMAFLSDITFECITGAQEIKLPIHVSCGIYPIHKEDKTDEVISRSLVVLREARKSTTSNTAYYTSEMYENAIYERQLIADFRTSLDNEAFQVFFQPKVDVAQRHLCGAEALVRWFRDDRIMQPDEFIPLLEREGLITELDFYVFERVCQSYQKWYDKGYDLVPVSVNFSNRHLEQDDFADKLIETADKYAVNHSLLDIELTESSGHDYMNKLNSFISMIRGAGMHTSMDDFGSGYSSLKLLDSSYFETINIDKTLTDRLLKGSHNKDFVKNIISAIMDMGCQVVCEGVETENQFEFLRQQTSCTMVQGHYFDKPLSSDEFERRLINPSYE